MPSTCPRHTDCNQCGPSCLNTFLACSHRRGLRPPWWTLSPWDRTGKSPRRRADPPCRVCNSSLPTSATPERTCALAGKPCNRLTLASPCKSPLRSSCTPVGLQAPCTFQRHMASTPSKRYSRREFHSPRCTCTGPGTSCPPRMWRPVGMTSNCHSYWSRPRASTSRRGTWCRQPPRLQRRRTQARRAGKMTAR